jgi:hypothetical protein
VFGITALCGCWPQEDPKKIYTIVLDNGKMQRTLKIPAAYIEEKNEKLRAQNGVRVGFLFPRLTPFVNETPTQDSVSVYIRLISDPSKPSRSEISLADLQRLTKKDAGKNTLRHVGKIDGFDTYEDIEPNTKNIRKTYFINDKSGNLICFEDSVFRVIATRRYSSEFEITFIFSPNQRSNQLEISSAITKLIERWLQK